MSARDALRVISADMAEGMRTFYQRPFTGATVGELLGNQAAAITRIADIVAEQLPDERMGVCRLCGRRDLPIDADGQLPPHEIRDTAKRSPFCRYRPATLGTESSGVLPQDVAGYMPTLAAMPGSPAVLADSYERTDAELDGAVVFGDADGYGIDGRAAKAGVR